MKAALKDALLLETIDVVLRLNQKTGGKVKMDKLRSLLKEAEGNPVKDLLKDDGVSEEDMT